MDFSASVIDNLKQLDGSNSAIISMMTGYTKQELDDLGGVPEQ